MGDNERSTVLLERSEAQADTVEGQGVAKSRFGGRERYWIKSCSVVEVTFEMHQEG